MLRQCNGTIGARNRESVTVYGGVKRGRMGWFVYSGGTSLFSLLKLFFYFSISLSLSVSLYFLFAASGISFVGSRIGMALVERLFW